MALKAVVISSDGVGSVVDEQVEVVEVLGRAEDVAVELDEVFKEISNSIARTIARESELIIELTGTITFAGNVDAKLLVVNVGGSGERQSSLKLTFKTTLVPIR